MEGGLSAWKSFKKNGTNSNARNYPRKLNKPFPPNPDNMKWHCNRKTRDWFPKKKGGENARDATVYCADQQNMTVIRTMSSSTLDSDDSYLRIKDDVSYNQNDIELVEHIVLPSDTLQGICIQYRISATKLRQINIFSGSSLKLAPKRLLVPVPISNCHSSLDSSIRLQDRTTKEYKLHKILSECPSLTTPEIESYLSLHNDDLENALNAALSDLDWEKTHMSPGERPNSLRKILDTRVKRKGSNPGITAEKSAPLIELKCMEGPKENWEDISVPESYKSVEDLTLRSRPVESQRPLNSMTISIPLTRGLRNRERGCEVQKNDFGIELREIATEA